MSSLVFIHKLIVLNEPLSLVLLYNNMNKDFLYKRHTAIVYPLYNPKLKRFKEFIIYNGYELYKSLPANIKNLTIEHFKSEIKAFLTLNYRNDKWNSNIEDEDCLL